MDNIINELGISPKNVKATNKEDTFVTVVTHSWLKKLMKCKLDFDTKNVNAYEATWQINDNVSSPWSKVFVRVFHKRSGKVFPLPRSKLGNDKSNGPLSFSQILSYVSQTNHRNLWKESYKKYSTEFNTQSSRELSAVNVLDYNSLLNEIILRLYGCNVIKIKHDPNDPTIRTSEIISSKNPSKIYDSQSNIMPVICAIDTDTCIFLVHHFHYNYTLSDCIFFSPALLDLNYSRCLFLLYQLLHVMRFLYNRGLNLGEIKLDDIFISENLWIQISPQIISNLNVVNPDDISEHTKLKASVSIDQFQLNHSKKVKNTFDLPTNSKRDLSRKDVVTLEKLCNLWVRGCLSNLDYLIHLNQLAGRRAGDPEAHHVVPWVTDFTSRCGKQWRDLTKSKYRLTKGDRQLDMTYDILGKETLGLHAGPHQIPHHVSDVLSDITYYVYMARRTSKELLCKNVRNNWVPAEYPSSIQRMQQWTPDECIPEFFTDSTVFKSIHEDLPDLEIPAWATCVEDFITKHREALESVQVSESLHHWIDLTFGYKLSGSAAVKAKNVCLSLVDGHTELTRSGPVQLFSSQHPARLSQVAQCWGEKLPPRIYWQKEKRKVSRHNQESSDEFSDNDDDLPQNVSNLSIPQPNRHSSCTRRKSSTSRTRRHNKKEEDAQTLASPTRSIAGNVAEQKLLSNTPHHFKVQKSELGKTPYYLPKEYNPLSHLQVVENLHVFKVKTFYKNKENEQAKTQQNIPDCNNIFSNNDIRRNNFSSLRPTDNIQSDENSFTNQMFVASYEQNLRRHKSENKETFKEIKDRSFNTRLVTNSAMFKHLVLSHRKKDMQVFGCLIVEIFLNHRVRPFQLQAAISFDERYKVCRLVLRNNLNILPKCVKYVACFLLQVNESDMSSEYMTQSPSDVNFPSIQKNGLPSPSAVQLLQPLLSNFLIPFPSHFPLLYSVVSILHEYSVSERESNILYSFECDGQNCSKFQHLDKTKLYFSQRIAEAKVYSCSVHMENLCMQMNSFSQFDSMDLFLPHFIELLTNKTTSILAAWYLFDSVSKVLGPNASINKLLPLILNLYDEHSTEKPADDNKKSCKFETSYNITEYNNKKSVKLYHHIFLLQLIVRFGLQCFLENFVPHLVEAVGGYKDNPISNSSVHTHSTNMQMKSANSLKKLTYCEEKPDTNNLSTDILSPDTSCGSENTLTPCIERDGNPVNDAFRKPRCVSAVESDVFHFETDSIKEACTNKSDIPSDDTKSWESSIFNKSNIKCLMEEIDCVSTSGNIEKYLDHSQAVEATESIGGGDREETNEDAQNTINEICFHENTYGSNNTSPAAKSPVGRPGVASPTIPIPNYGNGSFTSYVQRIDDENDASPDVCKEGGTSVSKSLDFSKKNKNDARGKGKLKIVPNHQLNLSSSSTRDYKISEMSSESLIWLAHRLGPVLTSKYLTRNLLKMLTLCYIGKENLMILKSDESPRTFSRLDTLCVVNGTLVGDCNATKVIDCLTSIVALYGEQIVLLQYFPHMGDLIASCKRRISAPLEGGLIACFQLLRHLVPYISDGKLMEQLRDIILKNILQPAVKLISSSRSTFPSGHLARGALARKFVETVYVIALRIGPEMTKNHLCDTVLPRFFMTFEKVHNKTEDLKISESANISNTQVDILSQEMDDHPSSLDEGGSYLEICRDGSTAEWKVRGGEFKPKISIKMGDPSGSSPDIAENTTMSAVEELQKVFHAELAHQSYMSFMNFVGEEAMDRCVKNSNTLKKLCQEFDSFKVNISISSTNDTKPIDNSPDDVFSKKALNESNPVKIGMDVHLGRSESIPCKSNMSTDEVPASSSFSSNVAIVGNRIDVQADLESDVCGASGFNYNEALDIVSCKIENGMRSSRHLRGDWLMYWEHEIGRSDKDIQFNLKQIKLQTFAGHTHSVRNIVCLDNENSFMSGSKDKTVKLWSLRNQGDGSFTSNCQWTYTGHRKGILSLTFLDSLRLSISTDAYVHIWDPYVENFIAQLDHCKSAPVSIVKAMPAPSSVVLAATTDTVLKLIDARNCSFIHELKVTFNPNTFIRCVCVSPSAKWVAVGLATGHLSLLDLRTGALIAHWKGHDGEILQLVTINETSIVSSSLDQTMWVWSTIDGKPRFQLKGSTEPVHCLSTYHSELISGTTNNRIGVHTAIDRNTTFSSTKLRSDTFKGVLTSMGVLQLNRMLLLGSESGNISLLC